MDRTTNSKRQFVAYMKASSSPNVVTLRSTRARPAYIPVNTETHSQVEPPSSRYPRKKRTVVVLFILGALIILIFLLFWTQVVIPQWINVQDQWHYGDSRITALDANVGHGGTSEFVAEYYKSTIVVIEVSGNNLETHTYVLTVMISGSTNTVIQLSIEPGKIPGKPDLLIQIQGSSFATILYNTGTTFQESEE